MVGDDQDAQKTEACGLGFHLLLRHTGQVQPPHLLQCAHCQSHHSKTLCAVLVHNLDRVQMFEQPAQKTTSTLPPRLEHMTL